MNQIDYTYSLDLLHRINAYVGKSPQLKERFVVGGYNFFQIYQQSLFADIKEYSVEKKNVLPPTERRFFSVKILFWILLSILISGWAFLLLVSKRKKVGVYAVDRVGGRNKSDFRMDEVYDFLNEKNVEYVNFLHTIFRRSFLQNFVKRKRSAIYLETIDGLFFLKNFFKKKANYNNVSVKGFLNEEENIFVSSLIKKYLDAVDTSVFRYRILSRLLKHSAMRTIFLLDDVRHYQELLLAAKENNIKTYAFQHGHFTKYHVGWLKMTSIPGDIMRPDKLFVWSEYWKRELLSLGSYFESSDIEIARKKGVLMAGQGQVDKEKICAIIPYETDAPKGEVAEYVQKILACNDMHVFFKTRSDMETQRQLNEYGLADLQKENFSTGSDIKEISEYTKVVAGTYSTYLYDMVEAGVPVVLLDTSLDYGEGIVRNSLATRVSLEDDICKKLIEVAHTPQEKLRERKERLVGENTKSIYDVLIDIVNKNPDEIFP